MSHKVDDTLKLYTRRMEVMNNLKKFMYENYREYWKFYRTTSCQEKISLEAYKNSSALINAILLVEEDPDFIRNVVSDKITFSHSCISRITQDIRNMLEKNIHNINNLDNLFKIAPTTSVKTIVYRGVEKRQLSRFPKLKKGSKFVLRSFTSTSFNANTALNFRDEEGVLFKFILPKRTKYLLLPGSAWAPGYLESKTFKELADRTDINTDEMELLLDRNLECRVEKIEHIFVESFKETSYAKAKNFQDKTTIYTVSIKPLTTNADDPSSIQLPKIDQILSIIDAVSIRLIVDSNN